MNNSPDYRTKVRCLIFRSRVTWQRYENELKQKPFFKFFCFFLLLFERNWMKWGKDVKTLFSVKVYFSFVYMVSEAKSKSRWQEQIMRWW